MASYKWPRTGVNCPPDLKLHAGCLKADFDLVSNTVATSLSCTTQLPSVLKPKILAGIEKGIAEARSNGYCPKWSEVDKSIFSKTILKNITAEAVNEARDRIPLEQFNGLRESYEKPHKKIDGQMTPCATNGDESSEEGSESEENVDAEDDQEEGQSEGSQSGEKSSGEGSCEDSSSGDNSSEDGSGEDSSGTEEDSETQSDAGSEEAENKELVTEQSVSNIVQGGNGFSATVNLEIKHQASVNKLEGITAREMLDCISLSLRSFLHQQRSPPPHSLSISDTSLLENGDVKVVVHAKTQTTLQWFINSASWAQDFETTYFGLPAPTYQISMQHVRVSTLNFQTRKEKSAIIRKLADANRAISDGNGAKPIIRDVSWAKSAAVKVKSSLTVEFLHSEEANRALIKGLYWQEWRYGCQRADRNCGFPRCSRCQAYGHLVTECTAPWRCAKCAGQHVTSSCKSEIVKCGSCGGRHHAGYRNCPEKLKAKKSLAFKNETTSQVTKPAAEAQATPSSNVRQSASAPRTQTEASMPSPVSLEVDTADEETKSKSDHSVVPEADPPQDTTHPETAILRQEVEELKKEVRALGAAVLQANNISAGTKRRADEAFTAGAEAESSNMAAKRIKQEEPTRENSMGLYRQPSPFIVHRPQ